MLLNCGVWEDFWESLGLARRSIQSILKEIQSSIFIGRIDAEAETPILWPPDAKNWLIGKDPDAGKDWSQEEKGTTEDEMVGWHHWLNEHEWVNSESCWWTGRPGMLQSMRSHRVRHDWAAELTVPQRRGHTMPRGAQGKYQEAGGEREGEASVLPVRLVRQCEQDWGWLVWISSVGSCPRCSYWPWAC